MVGVVVLNIGARPELEETSRSKPSAESVVFVGGTVFSGITTVSVWLLLVTAMLTSALLAALNDEEAAVDACRVQFPAATKFN